MARSLKVFQVETIDLCTPTKFKEELERRLRDFDEQGWTVEVQTQVVSNGGSYFGAVLIAHMS